VQNGNGNQHDDQELEIKKKLRSQCLHTSSKGSIYYNIQSELLMFDSPCRPRLDISNGQYVFAVNVLADHDAISIVRVTVMYYAFDGCNMYAAVDETLK
jgi:hypothetical protein